MTKKICVFWEGFPICGLLVSQLFNDPSIEIDLYVTQPSVPFENFYQPHGITLNVVEVSKPLDIEPSKYDLILVTGWSHKNWIKIVFSER